MAKTPKITRAPLPSSKVSISLTPGSIEPAMKSAEAKSTKLFKVPVASIQTIPGFNVRVQSADYLAHRDMIAESIRMNGYDQTKPLAGYVHKTDDGNVIYVTDGHTRLDAVNKLNAEEDFSPKIDMIPVLVHAADKTLADLTVALHTSNSGRPLTPFELGVVVKRLLKDEGADKTNIAARLSVTPRYLDDVLLLVNGPKAVREAVLDGTVSSTLAIQELRKAGDKPEAAAEKIAAAVAKATPGKKVTKKALGPKMKKVRATVSVAAGTDMKEIVKAVAAQVRSAIAHIPHATDPEAKVADVDGTITIVVEVPDTDEPAEKPAKKPAAKKADAKPAKKPAAKKAAAEPAPEPEAKPAAKKGGKKPAAKPEPAPAPEEDDNLTADDDDTDLGIEGAEEVTSDGEDDEPAITPIKVKNGEGVADDDVDI
jgi:ParB family chromosome partitioning protein